MLTGTGKGSSRTELNDGSRREDDWETPNAITAEDDWEAPRAIIAPSIIQKIG